MTNKLLPRLTVPHQNTANPAPISQRQRLDLLGRLLTDEEIPLLTRVAAVLMLLYAQPLTRVLRLTIHDILHHDGEVSVRLGEPPTPVPEPFAGLLIRYALTTATNAVGQQPSGEVCGDTSPAAGRPAGKVPRGRRADASR